MPKFTTDREEGFGFLVDARTFLKFRKGEAVAVTDPWHVQMCRAYEGGYLREVPPEPQTPRRKLDGQDAARNR